MHLVSAIWMALLGVLAVPQLLLAKKPEAKPLLDKITPFQGWIGVVSALWGLWGIITTLRLLALVSHWPIFWATYLASSLLQFALGMILGIGTMKTFIKAPKVVEKMDQLVAVLVPKQGILGIAGIAMGVWFLIAGFVFYQV